MSMVKRILYIIIGLLIATVIVCGQNVENPDSAVSLNVSSVIGQAGSAIGITKQDGDSAYMRNDYVTAIHVYEELLRRGESAEVYYNLGNSYYKADNIAKAILNYERALLLEPGNTDIRANLEVARSKTVDEIISVPELFFIAWVKALINILSVDEWARIGIVFFILLLVSFCIFLLSKQSILKKVSFIISLIFLVFTFLSNIFAYQQKKNLEYHNYAIILSPSVTVRSAPSESGTSLFVLHEGHKVEIKDDSMRAWKEIRLEDGKVGWVPVSSIERI